MTYSKVNYTMTLSQVNYTIVKKVFTGIDFCAILSLSAFDERVVVNSLLDRKTWVDGTSLTRFMNSLSELLLIVGGFSRYPKRGHSFFMIK